MSVRELTSEQMAYCEICEKHLGDFICGRRTPLHRFRDVVKGYFADVFAGLCPVGRRLLLQGADVRIWMLGLGAAGNICEVNKNRRPCCMISDWIRCAVLCCSPLEIP